MMRLNPAPRKNLHVGQRVQSDLRGDPEAVYVVRVLYDHPEASGGFAALVMTEDGKTNVTQSTTAACWFWPAGVLEAVPDSPSHVARLERELAEARQKVVRLGEALAAANRRVVRLGEALAAANRSKFAQFQRLQAIREALDK